MDKIQLKQGEMLCTTTIRIETFDADGKEFTGTGFYYSISDSPASPYIPAIITNRHLIEGMSEIKLVLTKADKIGNRINDHTKYTIANVLDGTIFHPNPDIDLCAITLNPILSDLQDRGVQIHTYYVNKEIIPRTEDLAKLDSIEEILMIGYPNGIWDEYNNMPIVRKGITATHPRINYNNLPEFLIDAACFPGSSGSPIYYLDKSFQTELLNGVIGHKVFLLGILYAGPETELEGVINHNPSLKTRAFTPVPINLGHVVRAEKLIDLENEIKKKVRSMN